MSGAPATYLERAAGWCWLLLCAIIPISGRFVPVPLAVTVVLLLVVYLRRRPVLPWRALWPLFAFYGLHIIGLAWSNDMGFGLFDAQIKLGLVLMPLAAAAYTAISSGGVHRSMVAFTVGTLIAIILSFGKGWACYSASGDVGCFAQSTFSFDLHPSYAAWYATWALAYWGSRAVNSAALRQAMYPLVLVLVLLTFITMLASKSGLIGLLLVVGVMMILLVKRLSPQRWLLGVGAGAIVLLVLLFFGGSRVMDRMRVALDAVETARRGDTALYASEGGSEMRLVAWQCSAELLAEHPLGSGTGDVKHALVECYTSKQAVAAAEKRMNSHSQFLQGGVALGWPGLIVSILVGLVPLLIGLREHHVLLALFAALFLLNAAVESVLEVQAGVVLVGIMLGLLAQHRTSYAPKPKDQVTA